MNTLAATHQVALIGLGLVGEALVERLLAVDFAVCAWDIAPARRDAVRTRGARVASSVFDTVRAAPFVLLALPDTPALVSVLDEVTPALAAGTTVIDMGTDDPATIVDCARSLAQHSVTLLDVPLSGSSEQIRNGESVAMGGGERHAWDASAPIVRAITNKAFYLGAAGSGSRAKLATNLLLGLNRAALAEALVFAETLGLDVAQFLALVRETPAYSRAVDAKGEKMRTRDYAPQSRIRQHRKDLTLMLDAAHAARCALPLTGTHAMLLDAAIASGDGELDNAAIIETIRRWPTPAPTP